MLKARFDYQKAQPSVNAITYIHLCECQIMCMYWWVSVASIEMCLIE